MSWRGDIAMGKYGKLPCALIDNNMFPSVEVDCGSFVVTCPCCGSQIPCLDIRFIDARDRLSDEVRKQTGVHMPVGGADRKLDRGAVRTVEWEG